MTVDAVQRTDPMPDEPKPAPTADAEEASPPRVDPSRCELCGFPLALERHCKIICPNCGYTRDCSDP